MRKFIFIASVFIAAALMFSANAVFAASGASLFNSEGCIACHVIDGKGGTVGPNLSHVGATRSLSWIKTQIVNPNAHFAPGTMVTINGKSFMAVMPDHKNMPVSQLNTLADYLASLK